MESCILWLSFLLFESVMFGVLSGFAVEHKMRL